MARVPGAQTLGNAPSTFVQQTGPRTLATNEAFGSQIARAQQEAGRGLRSLGQELSTIVLQEQADDNKRELKEALVRQSALEKEIFFGDGTKENPGFANLSGQAAIDGLQSARERLTEGNAEIAKNMRSNVQRKRFVAASAQAAVDAQARLNDHTSKQRKVANARTAKARQLEMKDNAVHDFRDPDRMDTNFAVVFTEAMTEGVELGLTEKALISHAETAVSEVAVQAIEAAIAEGDISMARQLLDKYVEKGQLDERFVPDLKKKLKEGNVRFASQEITDAIIGQGLAEGWTPQQFAAAARKVREKDPDVRLAVEGRITLFNAEQARAKKVAVTNAIQFADKFVANGEDPLDLPAEVKALLSTAKRTSLFKAAGQLASGVPSVTQWDRFDFYTLELPRDQVVGIDLGIAKTELAPQQFTIVERMVVTARTASAKAGPTEEQPFTPTQVFAAGIKNTPFAPRRREGPSRTKKRGLLQSLYMADVTTMERNNGPKKKLTATEHQKILTDLMDRVVVGSSFIFFDDEEPLFTVEVPPEDRAQIIEAIEAEGAVATEARIRQLFLLGAK